MLIAGSASVTVRNNRGETCLYRAAVGGHVEAVRAIVGEWIQYSGCVGVAQYQFTQLHSGTVTVYTTVYTRVTLVPHIGTVLNP